MVKGNQAYKIRKLEEEKNYTYLPDPLKYTSVSLKDVFLNKFRLEGNVFSIEAKKAKEKILANKYGVVKLWSENGLIKNAFHRPRFKRVYVKTKEIPFYQPSTITELYPKPSKYISAKTNTDIENLKVKKGMLLMTISGTIGKVAIVGKKIDNQVFSHDLLRLLGKGSFDTGYIYTYFLTIQGQHILQSNNYGAVIKHIEPKHLKEVIIPNAPEILKKSIHELVIKSYELRDKSNDLIDEAEDILYKELNLKPIEELKLDYFDYSHEVSTYCTKISEFKFRLDGSYHLPKFRACLKLLIENSKEVKVLKDICTEIRMPGIFKRIYVNKENGVPFIGTKEMKELNPKVEKYLSKVEHKKLIKNELALTENTILQSNRGSVSVGDVVLVPKHFEENNVTASQNCLRIIADKNIAGYLYCYLNSEYGRAFSRKEIYGSTIDMIDPNKSAQIPVPIMYSQEKQNKINDLVLQANKLRYEAYQKEQAAIQKMEDIINTLK